MELVLELQEVGRGLHGIHGRLCSEGITLDVDSPVPEELRAYLFLFMEAICYSCALPHAVPTQHSAPIVSLTPAR